MDKQPIIIVYLKCSHLRKFFLVFGNCLICMLPKKVLKIELMNLFYLKVSETSAV